MNLFNRIVVRHAGLIALVGTLIALVGAYFSVRLYMNLRTDIEELLPTTARSVKDLEQVTQRLESIDNMVVLIFSKNTGASKRFVDDLAGKLKQVPRTVISSVEYRIDRELKFFSERRALYIDLPDLYRVRNYIQNRIDYEKELYNPLNIFREENGSEPQLNYEAMRKKYDGQIAGYDHFPGGYYATADEKIRAFIVYIPGKGLDKAQRMKEAVEKAVMELKPQSYAPDLEVKYTGNIQNLLEESAALVEDLELSTVIVMVLVTFAMVVFYRSLTATAALVFSLLMGTFWTFGIAYFAVGYLNANTAFLASIVIGNGINFGVILLARYLEERRGGKNNDDAMTCAVSSTYIPTLTAALAAGLSYGSLMLTGFRGFSQFGVIGLVGMVFCWLSAYTLLPAYLTLLDRWKGERWMAMSLPKPILSGAIAHLVQKMPRLVCFLSIAGVAATVVLLQNFKGGLIETDLTKLRDKRSIEKGSGALYHYIDDVFQHSFSPMVILPKDREDSRRIAKLLKEERDRHGKSSLISTVQSLDDFVPKNQGQKIKVLREIEKLLPKKYIDVLAEKERRLVKELLNPKAFYPFVDMDLPPLVLGKFTERDGTVGKIVLVDKVIDKDRDDVQALSSFVQLGRDVTDSVVPLAPVAGDLPISYDMFQAITHDGPRATFFAFLAVVILVIVLFRKAETISLILMALMLGVTWMAGLILGFNLKINFLNFIALPITFGIGVDYGVNIFQRYREEGAGNILGIVRNTGGAVLLSSLTTIIGYSSLLIAGNQAFVSFGRLAVIGELTCVTAAVVSLPAFLYWREKRKVVAAQLSMDEI